MNITYVEPVDLHNRPADAAKAVLIDVRTSLEFAEVHVPQAVNVPLDQVSSKTLAEAGCVAGDQPVYLLCRGGQRAAKAAETLLSCGYQRPVVVKGGTQAWIEAGLPVVRGTVKTISLERQVRIAAGTLVFTGALLAWFVHPAFVWLSGFVGAGLVFAGATDFCGMGLLIARMPWNRR